MRHVARVCALVNGLADRSLERVKAIHCNIFVKKMKYKAAEAFLKGAVRRMVGPNKEFWRRVLAADAIEFMVGPEVNRWRRILRALSRHVYGMQNCRLHLANIEREGPGRRPWQLTRHTRGA